MLHSKDVVYSSDPYLIGDHEWKIVVMPLGKQVAGNCDDTFHLEYYWRKIGCDRWMPKNDWPTYNINDGMHAGCPRTLKKLYLREQAPLSKFFPTVKERFEQSDEYRQMPLL